MVDVADTPRRHGSERGEAVRRAVRMQQARRMPGQAPGQPGCRACLSHRRQPLGASVVHDTSDAAPAELVAYWPVFRNHAEGSEARSVETVDEPEEDAVASADECAGVGVDNSGHGAGQSGLTGWIPTALETR